MIADMSISLLIGAACGSIPFGILLARLHGLPDPRQVGSGNIGATNMLRTGNKKVAALTLLLDAIKAAMAVYLAQLESPAYGAFALLGACLGHIYCPWLGFKGGKGVACAMGGLLMLAPLTGLITCALWLTVFFSSRISSLSALISLMLAPFILWWDTHAVNAIIMLLAVSLISYRHKENIDRLIRGKETPFIFSKDDDDTKEGHA
jgi:glycerol-3-phosphate acyltransferase PlsY